MEAVTHLSHQDEQTVELNGTCQVIPSGIFTVSGPFGHRTFSIERQSEKAEFKPGKRIIYLLVKHDNELDWKPFGDVHDGVVRWPINVWLKIRQSPDGDDFVFYAERLTHMIVGGFRRFIGPDGQSHTYQLMMSRRCFRCDRRLTTPESIASGIGPECSKKGAR